MVNFVESQEDKAWMPFGGAWMPFGGAWMPFGGGPRICPEAKLAEMELVCILAHIFHHFSNTQLVTCNGQVSEHVRFVLGPSHLWLHLGARNTQQPTH
jgi:cytochrome P450